MLLLLGVLYSVLSVRAGIDPVAGVALVLISSKVSVNVATPFWRIPRRQLGLLRLILVTNSLLCVVLEKFFHRMPMPGTSVARTFTSGEAP